VLRAGGLVAFPTDTLYALGADAASEAAVERLLRTKGREDGKSLPLLVDGLEMAAEVAELSPAAEALARAFWPGPLTLVLRKRPSFRSRALSGDTVAVRAPAHELALAIIRVFGRPVTGTSANRSGGRDPDTAAEVQRQLGEAIDLVIDGGPCRAGRPSTIVDLTGPRPLFLRKGVLSRRRVLRALLEG
jgi:L-threonylcarbamoyladenylate synthase